VPIEQHQLSVDVLSNALPRLLYYATEFIKKKISGSGQAGNLWCLPDVCLVLLLGHLNQLLAVKCCLARNQTSIMNFQRSNVRISKVK
jgi:hypothetical protein